MVKKVTVTLLILFVFISFLIGAAVLYIAHRVQGSTFQSAGVSIHYTDEGRGDPVILLHGFAVNADLNWRRPKITQRLAKEFRVIAPDLRGHGLSDKPYKTEQYGLEMTRDVIRLMDHLEIPKAHLAGYSLGGFLALKLATTNPDRLLSVSAMGSGWERPEQSAFLDALQKFADSLESGKGIGPLAVGLGSNREKPSWVHSIWVRMMTGYFNNKQALIGVIRGLPALAIEKEDLLSVRVPLCSIVGSRDPLKFGADALASHVSLSQRVIVKDADHIQTPFRKETIDSLILFLRQCGSVDKNKAPGQDVINRP